MKLFGVIYKHTNILNNKVYIGQTIRIENIERRFRRDDPSHRAYKNCTVMYRALNKYGWNNFTTEVIFSAFDQDALTEAEGYFINLYNSVAPNGYNSTMIVNGGVKFTDEIKKKIGDKQRAFNARRETPVIANNRKEHIFIDGVEYKHCTKCDTNKGLDAFSKDRNRWDQLATACKVCAYAYDKQKQYRKKLSGDDLKKSYEDRQKSVSEGVRRSYEENPDLKLAQAKRKSKPVIATNIITGEELHFESAKAAKEFGYCNTRIGESIKSGKPHKQHTWRFK